MAVTKVDRIAGGASVSIPVSLTTSMGATTTDGILLGATNSATAGAQVFSPALHFQGSGWKTNATAAAQSCDWQIEVEPLEGAAAPTNYLVFKQSLNGAAYSNVMNITQGEIYLTGSVNLHDSTGSKLACLFGTGVISANRTAGGYYFNAGNTNVQDTSISSPSAGVVAIGTGAAGDFAGALKLTRLVTAPLTFATLPASPSTGARCMITDATSTVFAALATTGGAIIMPVFYDGTNWKIG